MRASILRRPRLAQRGEKPLGVGVGGVEGGLHETEEMFAHPRNPGELGPVRHLVTGIEQTVAVSLDEIPVHLAP